MASKDFDLKGILSVREAKEDDARNLQAYCFLDKTVEEVVDDIKADLAEDSQKTRLIAESSGHAIGHISVEQHSLTPNVGQISDLAVAGPFRQLGVADYLIAAAETAATEKGMETLEIELSSDENQVIQRYKDWGFSEKPIVTLQKTITAETPTDVEKPEENANQEEDDTEEPEAQQPELFSQIGQS